MLLAGGGSIPALDVWLNMDMKRMQKLTTQLIALLFASLISASQVIAVQAKSQIRKVDFRNFSFPGLWEKHINLRDGKLEVISPSEGCNSYTLKSVDYADLTGDGKEEALIHMDNFSGCGSAGYIDYYYIYTLRNNRPRLLWKYSTGNDAQGGLKTFSLNGRELVFELFGKSRIVGTKTKDLDETERCCPRQYSRIRVAWDGRRFRQRGVEYFPFPYKNLNDYYVATKNYRQ